MGGGGGGGGGARMMNEGVRTNLSQYLLSTSV